MKAEGEVQTLLVPGHENNFWEVMAEKTVWKGEKYKYYGF